MRAEEAWAASPAIGRPGREVDVVIEVEVLYVVGGAAPSGLTAVDPRGEVAVLVGPHIVLLAAGKALGVELELRGSAHA